MIKVIGTAYKRDDFSTQEFFDYWRDVHAPISAKIGPMRGYVVSEVIRKVQGELQAEAFIEQWWDDLDAFEKAARDARDGGRLGGRRELRQDHRDVLGDEGARLHPASHPAGRHPEQAGLAGLAAESPMSNPSAGPGPASVREPSPGGSR